MRLRLLLALLLLPLVAHAQEAPLVESRGVWFATVLGDGDWPENGTFDDAAKQEADLRERIRTAHARGFNTFVFQAVARGDAMYQSDRLPWSEKLRGAGVDPGYDPLAAAIDEAHALGMELHAWFNVFRVGDSSTRAAFDGAPGPTHVLHAHDEWIQERDEGRALWIDPSVDTAREWLVENVAELVERYDVDAVHFDFIRYAQGGFQSDQANFSIDPRGFTDIDDWRRDNVSLFVREAFERVVDLKPWVKLGAAPIGHYAGPYSWPALLGYHDVFQASRAWMDEGVMDYLAPQIYWTIGGAPDYAFLAQEWADATPARPVVAGIGAYVDGVDGQIGAQVDAAREAGMEGQFFFRYDHAMSVDLEGRYALPALPAPTAHRFEAAIPTAPTALVGGADGDRRVELTWAPSAAGRDTDPVRAYAVFRSADGEPDVTRSAHLVGVAPADATSWVDVLDADRPEVLRYQVVAISRLGLRSAASNTAVVDDPVARESPEGRPALAVTSIYPNPARDRVQVEIEGAGRDARLAVYDVLGRIVLRAPAGGALDVSRLAPGTYVVVVRDGGRAARARFVVAR